MSRNGVHCMVPGCLNAKSNKLLSFFALPSDEERRKSWLKTINRVDLLEKPDLKPKSYVVCSNHFETSMILQTPHLRPDAIPTKTPDVSMPVFKTELEEETSEVNAPAENSVTRKASRKRYYCSAYGCGTSCDDNKSNGKLSFFSLPVDEERRNVWLKIIGRPELTGKSHVKPKSHVVCSLHFEAAMIVPRPKLSQDAIPTKNIPENSELQASSDVSTQTHSKINNSKSISYSVKTQRKRASNNKLKDTKKKRKTLKDVKEN